jgi:hypothetical protein
MVAMVVIFLQLLLFLTVTEADYIRHDRRNSQPVVDLGYARYQGVALEAGVNQFLGMRYAAPPLGDLRWRAPQDPLRNESLQDTSQVSNSPSMPVIPRPSCSSSCASLAPLAWDSSDLV